MSSPTPIPSDPPHHPGFGTGRDLWLLRHGEVHEDWQGRIYGALDVPLSRAGRRESRRVARAFRSVPIERVLSSSLARARTLGRLLSAATGAPLDVFSELREIERGTWAGRTIADVQERSADEIAAFFDGSWTWNGYRGESDGMVWARAWPVVAEALRAGRGPLAVCAHYNVVRILVARLLGVTPPDSFRLRVDLSRAVLLRDTPAGWVLLRSNVSAPRA